MKIAVAGTGYVGLVSGVCLAEKGHDVICIDMDPEKVEKINNGIAPIYEEGLDELLKRHVGTRLKATTDLASAVIASEMSLIAVGTPFDGKEIDISYIKQVSKEIGQALRQRDDYHVVVVKSTVVPGTTDDVVKPVLEEASGKIAGEDFGVGMNPEFLREGAAISDFMAPDRIVLGGMDERTLDVLAKVYSPFTDVDILKTNPKTAEMIKYASNSLLATLISFSNEIGNLCASVGEVDAMEVMRGVHLDKRFSPIMEDGSRVAPASLTYLEAGCGFGGSCFPKDVKALVAHGQKHGRDMALLESVIAVNQKQPEQMLMRLKKHFSDWRDLKVAVLGLAFKPGTDDMRESPAIPVVEALIEAEADIKAFDPIAQEEAEKVFKQGGLQYAEKLEQALEDVQVVLLMTRWAEFAQVPELLGDRCQSVVMIDGRRMLPKTAFAHYEGIGLAC